MHSTPDLQTKLREMRREIRTLKKKNLELAVEVKRLKDKIVRKEAGEREVLVRLDRLFQPF
jgi:hypothetical protein